MKRLIQFRVWWDGTDKRCPDCKPSMGGWIKDTFQLSPRGELYSCSNQINPEAIFGGYTIEQFTGLTDKHGKDIYEGDIVKSTWRDVNPYESGSRGSHDEEEITVVAYLAPGFNLSEPCGDGGQSYIEDFAWEVIGNVHENPELVK